jgi:hypothetical protein
MKTSLNSITPNLLLAMKTYSLLFAALVAVLASPLFATAANIAQQAYIKASNTGEYDAFGQVVAVSGDTMVIGAPYEASNATGVNGNQTNNLAPYSGAAYVFVRTGGVWLQQAYLKASNTGENDNFGYSVAISGDIIVVGAPSESSAATGVNGNQNDNSAPYSGAAYVFVRNGTNWSQQAYVKASNTGEGDGFGLSVAISGDTIVVGAPSESSAATGVNGDQNNDSTPGAGAAYTFVRSGGVWAQQAYLKASNPDENDYFGERVAISGDTVVVGAVQESSAATGVNGDQGNNSALGAGAAYVFVRSGLTWSQQAYLKASNPDEYDFFGISVAVSGNTVVVGAYGESSSAVGVNGDQDDNSAFGAGAAYVFVRNGMTWSQQAYLKASNTGEGDNFGDSVAISGNTVVVGADYEDSNATGANGNEGDGSAYDSGAAYVFVRSGANWSQAAYLKASNTESYDFFGYPASVSGSTVVVGAYGEDSNASGVNGNEGDNSAVDSGAAYVFDLNAPAAPEIVVEQPAGNNLIVGAAGGVDFGILAVGESSQLTFTIRNLGSADLTGLGLTITGPDAGDFTVTANPTAPVVAGGSTTFTVVFSPGSQGAKAATLRIASNDSSENPFDIALRGTGPFSEIVVEQPEGSDLADGANVSFGTLAVGATNQISFTIRNTGTLDLTGLGITITGPNASDFTVITNPVAPVAGGGTTTFTVAFSPGDVGVRTAVLQIASNDADENPFDIELRGTGPIPFIQIQLSSGNYLYDGASVNFGSGQVGFSSQRTFIIRNYGNSDLTGLGLTITGPNASDFLITTNPTAPVAAFSGSTTFTVAFTCGGLGDRTADLQLTSNDPNQSPFDITLAGIGLPPGPEIVVEQPPGSDLPDGAGVDFGGGLVGATSERIFTILNIGNSNLTGLDITITGPHASDFAVTANPTSPLAGDDSTTFTVTFTRGDLGDRMADLRLASNDTDENPFDLTLTGTGFPLTELVVTNVEDSGPGSLRQAILVANAAAGIYRITFSIPGPAPFSIRPLSPLEAINQPVIIDATTQPGFAGTPIVELRGDAAGAASGLSIGAGGTTIRGLVINRFSGSGIWLLSGGNIIQGNYIGTDISGTTSLGNSAGISVQSDSNQIGGTNAGTGNVISGNACNGVLVYGADNQIQGNIIGLNADGTAKLGNGCIGLWFLGSARNNVAGGVISGARNVISGNGQDGVAIYTGGNRVEGNIIGLNATGTAAIGNANSGVYLLSGAVSNVIGGTLPGAGNVISGNSGAGVWIHVQSAHNRVEGNFIGLNAAGTAAIGNGSFGVLITFDSVSNVIGGTLPGARNVISGNTNAGISISASANRVEGNFIGLNAAGTAALGNTTHGVELYSTSNVIGGGLAGAGNVVSGNGQQGIYIQSPMNTVQGNVVGLNASDTAKVPNGQFGIALVNSFSNTIGGTVAGARNVISGNNLSGVILQDAWRNSVEGNFIGLNAAGTASLGNGQDGIILSNAGTNWLGGTRAGAGNVISGNGLHGIEFIGGGARSNVIQGNLIGTDATGTNLVGNQQVGIYFFTAPNNLVGGATNTARNVICGNRHGVFAEGAGASGNQIQGNYIGVDISGQRARGNREFGVAIFGVPNHTVGGTNAALRNVISGNGLSGVLIQNPGATGNRVQGNFIGTDASGQLDLGNGEDGVFISGGVNNVVGGTTPGAGNLLSGNGLSGIEIWNNASGNLVQGNQIGTDATGANGLGNTEHGIYIQNSSRNTVGGTAAGAGNVIAFNQLDGVFVESGTNNLVRANSIFGNAGLGIDLGANGVTANDAGDADVGANTLQNHPVLTSALANLNGSTTMSGRLLSRATASFTIEFFANLACDASGNGEGQQSIGLTNVLTAANGSNCFTVTFTNTIPAGRFITATATDAATNTSEFSACVQVMSVAPARPYLTSAMSLANGAFQFAFTDPSGASFTVLSSTNVSLPASNWTVLGSALPVGGGLYQFIDPDATNHSQRFYQLRWP